MSERKALIVGVTGTTGYTTARHLLGQGWEVHGISRRPVDGLDGRGPDPRRRHRPRGGRRRRSQGADFSHVFYCTGPPGHRGREHPGERRMVRNLSPRLPTPRAASTSP